MLVLGASLVALVKRLVASRLLVGNNSRFRRLGGLNDRVDNPGHS